MGGNENPTLCIHEDLERGTIFPYFFYTTYRSRCVLSVLRVYSLCCHQLHHFLSGKVIPTQQAMACAYMYASSIIIILYWWAHLSKSFQINSKRRWAESCEACCQRALLNVQIITLFTVCTEVHLSSCQLKVHAGSFCASIIHQTLTWTTGSLTCAHDHSCACVYTHG